MKHLVQILLIFFVLAILCAGYGFLFAFVRWDFDTSFGASVLQTPYDPTISRNLALWSVCLVASLIMSLILYRLYRQRRKMSRLLKQRWAQGKMKPRAKAA